MRTVRLTDVSELAPQARRSAYRRTDLAASGELPRMVRRTRIGSSALPLGVEILPHQCHEKVGKFFSIVHYRNTEIAATNA